MQQSTSIDVQGYTELFTFGVFYSLNLDIFLLFYSALEHYLACISFQQNRKTCLPGEFNEYFPDVLLYDRLSGSPY